VQEIASGGISATISTMMTTTRRLLISGSCIVNLQPYRSAFQSNRGRNGIITAHISTRPQLQPIAEPSPHHFHIDMAVGS